MIIGTGIDILDISRIKLEHAKRVLSKEETKLFDSFSTDKRKIEFLAGRFALKEAIIKAIGHTKYVIGMRDITILNESDGMPKLIAPVFEDITLHISLSHEHKYAVGLCIIENV